MEQDYPELVATFKQVYKLTDLPEYLDADYVFLERFWEQNMRRILGQQALIKYLIITATAPANLDDYFYLFCQGVSNDRIIKALAPECKYYNPQVRLEAFTRKQALLINLLPFKGDFRDLQRGFGKRYQRLVKTCAATYFHDKLFDPRLPWEEEVKLAFLDKKAAVALRKVFPRGLVLPNQQVVACLKDHVAAKRLNRVSVRRLKEVFDLD